MTDKKKETKSEPKAETKKRRSFTQKVFGRFIESEVNSQLRERLTAANNREMDQSTFRSITRSEKSRDLTPIKQEKMIEVVDYLRERNPIAKRILSLSRSFVLGEGVSFSAEDEDVKAVMDRFWNVNHWPIKQYDRILELGQYGEQIYRTFVDEDNGVVKLGAIDSKCVDEILMSEKNQEQPEKITLQSKSASTENQDELAFDIIKEDFDYNTTTKKMEVSLEGEVFFFPVNKPTFASRGKSDILAIADWLDMYDRSLFTMTERVNLLMAFVWDIEIEGADKPTLDKRFNELKLQPPKPGSFQVHNEKEKWDSVSPDLRGRDFTDFYKVLRTQLTGGAGFPFHWLFGTGENANKATAIKMDDPVLQELSVRRKYVVRMFEMMFAFAIQEAKKAEMIPADADTTFKVWIVQPSAEKSKAMAKTIQELTTSLMLQTEKKWITDDSARKIIAMLLSEIGIDIDPDEERDGAIEESVGGVYNKLDKLKESLKTDGKANKKTKASLPK